MRLLFTFFCLCISACATDSRVPTPPVESSTLSFSLYRHAKLESIEVYHGPFFPTRGSHTLLNIRRQWVTSDGRKGDGFLWFTLPNEVVVGTQHSLSGMELHYHAIIETTLKGKDWALGTTPTGHVQIEEIQADRIRFTIDCVVPAWRDSTGQPLVIRESRWIAVSAIPESKHRDLPIVPTGALK